MRKLKFHEQKLLKKVDFLTWKQENNLREIKVLRRYHIQDREDYVKCVCRLAVAGLALTQQWGDDTLPLQGNRLVVLTFLLNSVSLFPDPAGTTG